MVDKVKLFKCEKVVVDDRRRRRNNNMQIIRDMALLLKCDGDRTERRCLLLFSFEWIWDMGREPNRTEPKSSALLGPRIRYFVSLQLFFKMQRSDVIISRVETMILNFHHHRQFVMSFSTYSI